MGRECNLELGLCPSSASMPSFHSPRVPMMTMPFTVDNQQQIMVFYNGKINSCDLTELQARAIIWFASQERNGNTIWPNPERLSLQLPMTGFSMKKSLQRFLQRRKKRIPSMSPYHKF